MKKFAIMILGVSMFFIGLGAIAKQFSAKHKSDKREVSFVRQSHPGIKEVDEKMKSIQLIRTPKEDFVIKRIDEELPMKHPEADLQFHEEFKKKFDLHVAPDGEFTILTRKMNSPPHKNVIIMRNDLKEKSE